MTKRLRHLLPAAAISLALFATGCKKQPPKQGDQVKQEQKENLPPYGLALQGDVNPGKLAALQWPDFSDYKSSVIAFYQDRKWKAAWSKSGKPTRQAQDLIKSFAQSEERGLNPEDYDTSRWQQRIGELASKSNDTTAAFDAALTIIAMRYISDLHIGRVNPKHFSFGVNIDQKKYDLPKVLEGQIVDSSDVEAAINATEPQTEQYKSLKSALRHYRDLAAQDQTKNVPLVTGKSVEPGQPYTGSARLQAKLKLFGDESADDPDTTAKSTYDRDLADAVKHFQYRHGLAADGKLGKDTTAALNVPASTRLNEILDTMERWRWLPEEYQTPTLFVNLPEFILRGYNSDDHKLDFTMRVVVGQANDEHRTPVLVDKMKYLIFRPFWNVPISIAKKELVPHVEANPDYLAEKNYEATRGGKVVQATAFQIAHSIVMVREKPGPTNSLGLVKFMFPNQFNVYLHSTPSVSLFGRTTRAYSHGCVRVQEPEKLAAWLLRDNAKWDQDKINEAMQTGQDNKTVGLSHPNPIIIFYATAFIAEDGEPHFFNDIYTYDKLLEDTLKHGPPYPQKPVVQKVEADV